MSGALQEFFTRGKADDAGVLSPGKEENADPWKKGRKDRTVFKFGDYIVKGVRQIEGNKENETGPGGRNRRYPCA